jgi:hypothetical protein
MSKKSSQRGTNGSGRPNGHVNSGGDTGAHDEVQRPHSRTRNGKPPKGNGSSSQDNGDAVELLRPTAVAAIQDGATYFDAVAARVDLVAASVRLIINKDLKLSKSELDRLREMKFGKVGASAVEEPPQLDFSDWPRRNR